MPEATNMKRVHDSSPETVKQIGAKPVDAGSLTRSEMLGTVQTPKQLAKSALRGNCTL